MKKQNQMSIGKDNKISISTSYLIKFKNLLLQNVLLIKFLFIITTLFFLNIGAKSPLMSEPSENRITIVSENEINEVYPSIVRERLQEDLITEVRNYIKKSAPTSKLDAKLLVTLCQKYDIDITFVLAQGMLESTLGTKGKAATTNSVWNVGTYDDGQIRYTYKTQNHSIEPFLKLIREKYLGDKKTIANLIKDGGYKTLTGYRYATFLGYESRLRTMMVHVHMHSSINMYQDVINLSDEKILAYFSPVVDTILSDSTKLLSYLQK